MPQHLPCMADSSHPLSWERRPDARSGPAAVRKVTGRQLHGHTGTRPVSHSLASCGLLPRWMRADSACMGTRGDGTRLSGERSLRESGGSVSCTILGCVMSASLDSRTPGFVVEEKSRHATRVPDDSGVGAVAGLGEPWEPVGHPCGWMHAPRGRADRRHSSWTSWEPDRVVGSGGEW